MNDIYQLCDEIFTWQSEVFGSGQKRVLPTLRHLSKEITTEIIEPMGAGKIPENLPEEYADCFILLINALYNSGYTFKDLELFVRRKFAINKARKWSKPNEEGIIEHVREEDGTA
ncbi:MAG TPA: dATP/dGTP pyrophosphohydrolase domain-containing protein [Parasegetibacter sp.]|jgi:hypothetical protein